MKVALGELRERLDSIDKEIVSLYEERMDICEQVGVFKLETGKPVFDKKREMEKLEAVERLATTSFNKRGVRELFEHVMAMSRKLQYRLLASNGAAGQSAFIKMETTDHAVSRVVFQGVAGAYSQMALRSYFGEGVNMVNVETFRDAMETIVDGGAEYAVLPIENSSAGVVAQVYDLLVEYENYIIGEVTIPIEHALVGIKGAEVGKITHVYSHPQALMQSEKYLNSHKNMQQISVLNTAIAAQKVLDDNDKSQAAICSEYAADLYGLEVLAKQINHNNSNSTRFIVVSNQKVFLEGAKKISICFEIPHESGSLYHILSHFIYNDLNMTKIESRPIEGRNWEYRFFIDFEGNMESAAVKNAMRGLREEVMNLRVLGNY